GGRRRRGCAANVVTERGELATAAVFLDRDGTIIEDVGYLRRLEQIAIFPWSADAIRCLNRAGLPVVVTTNQAGVARGMFTDAFVDETHLEISKRLPARQERVDPDADC